MNNQQAYEKIKDVVNVKLSYYQKVQNMFPDRSRTEVRELKEALKLLEELFNKQNG